MSLTPTPTPGEAAEVASTNPPPEAASEAVEEAEAGSKTGMTLAAETEISEAETEISEAKTETLAAEIETLEAETEMASGPEEGEEADLEMIEVIGSEMTEVEEDSEVEAVAEEEVVEDSTMLKASEILRRKVALGEPEEVLLGEEIMIRMEALHGVTSLTEVMQEVHHGEQAKEVIIMQDLHGEPTKEEMTMEDPPGELTITQEVDRDPPGVMTASQMRVDGLKETPIKEHPVDGERTLNRTTKEAHGVMTRRRNHQGGKLTHHRSIIT